MDNVMNFDGISVWVWLRALGVRSGSRIIEKFLWGTYDVERQTMIRREYLW